MTNWNDMPFEMKEMIVKEMDIITRTRLKQCSKSDKYLVESIPYHFSKLSAKNSQSDGFYDEIDDFNLEFDEDYGFDFYDSGDSSDNDDEIEYNDNFNNLIVEVDGMKFYKRGKKVKIMKDDVKRQVIMETTGEAFGRVRRYFEGILMQKNVFMKQFETNWSFPYDLFTSNHQIHTKSIKLSCELPNQCIAWLKHVAPKVEKIIVKDSFDIGQHGNVLEDVSSISIVKNASHLELPATDINDDDLLGYKATYLQIIKSKLTGNGVNRFLKKWIDEDYPIDSQLRIKIKTTTVDITNGFEYSIIKQSTTNTWIRIRMNNLKDILLHCETPHGDDKNVIVKIVKRDFDPFKRY